MDTKNQISCPNCGTTIDVQNILAHQLEEEFKKKFEIEEEAQNNKIKEERNKFLKAKAEFEALKENEIELFNKRVAHELSNKQKALELEVKAKLEEEQSERFQFLQNELNEKSEQVKELNRSKAEIEMLKREKGELKELAQAEAEKTLNDTLKIEREKAARQLDALLEEKAVLVEEKKTENERFVLRLEQELRDEKKRIEHSLKEKLEEEQSERFQLLQKELNEKSEQVRELNRSKAEIEKLKREKGELKEAVEAEAQRKLNETLLTERDRIIKAEQEKNELRFREMQKQLEDQRTLTEEMKRKQEQGSMQLQGEVQELAIEEWLGDNFPLDTIDEIKKGATGADCLQIINTHTQQNCGSIYYESKRTKSFSPAWIEKFKADMRANGSTIGVLVTEAMPNDIERMTQINGVWVCSFDEFKNLCFVLRESVIQLHLAAASQENKGDKMHMIYDYLTSSTFRMQIEAIVEGFSTMKNDLESEKRSMQRIWKQRDKQIEKVITNTIDMYGSIKGIAGNAVQAVPALELGGEIEEDKENILNRLLPKR